MNTTLLTARLIFMTLTMICMILFTVDTQSSETASLATYLGGIALGIIASLCLLGVDHLLRRLSIQKLTVISLGLLVGALFGTGLWVTVGTGIKLLESPLTKETIKLAKLFTFFIGAYLGLIMAIRSSEGLLPYLQFPTQTGKKRQRIILDESVLTDGRVVDLASTGIFDGQLLLPRAVMESVKSKEIKRGLDSVKRLQKMEHLDLEMVGTSAQTDLCAMAKTLPATLFTADVSHMEMNGSEPVTILSLHALAKALKPMTEAGEFLQIKIQRYGKEPRQGIGYLDDGTMVVVNGGGDYIGQTIKAQVLSVKHTSTGRMVFTNAQEEAKERTEVLV